MLALALRSKGMIQGRSHTSGVPTEPAISSHSRFPISVTFRGSNICSTVVNMPIGNIHLLVSCPDMHCGAKHINLHFWWNAHDDHARPTCKCGRRIQAARSVGEPPLHRPQVALKTQSVFFLFSYTPTSGEYWLMGFVQVPCIPVSPPTRHSLP